MKLVAFSPPLSAFDQDSGVNSPLTYAITSGNADGYFSIDTATGLVYQTEEIDREELVRRRKVNEMRLLIHLVPSSKKGCVNLSLHRRQFAF